MQYGVQYPRDRFLKQRHFCFENRPLEVASSCDTIKQREPLLLLSNAEAAALFYLYGGAEARLPFDLETPLFQIFRSEELNMYFDAVEFGKRVAKQRRLMDLTQDELAKMMNLSTSHIGRMELGKEGPSTDVLIELSQKLNLSIDYLLTGKIPERQILRNEIRSIIDFLTAIERTL